MHRRVLEAAQQVSYHIEDTQLNLTNSTCYELCSTLENSFGDFEMQTVAAQQGRFVSQNALRGLKQPRFAAERNRPASSKRPNRSGVNAMPAVFHRSALRDAPKTRSGGRMG
jgi:hypothetical protein